MRVDALWSPTRLFQLDKPVNRAAFSRAASTPASRGPCNTVFTRHCTFIVDSSPYVPPTHREILPCSAYAATESQTWYRDPKLCNGWVLLSHATGHTLNFGRFQAASSRTKQHPCHLSLRFFPCLLKKKTYPGEPRRSPHKTPGASTQLCEPGLELFATSHPPHTRHWGLPENGAKRRRYTAPD